MKLTLDERNMLRQLMNEQLNLDELSEVMARIGVDPENVPGVTRLGKVRELIGYSERWGLVEALLRELVLFRPQVTWPRQAELAVPEPVVEPPEERVGCDITAVLPHLNPLASLETPQKIMLANLLLATPTMGNPQSRQGIVGLLPEQIRNSVQPGPNATFEVVNLLTACLNYAGGLGTLIQIVHLVEQESQPMQAVCQFLLTLK